MTQLEEIYNLLVVRGNLGINSFEPLRNNKRQLPRIINDLETKDPWNLKGKIEHKRERNTSMTYIYHPSWEGTPTDSVSEEKKKRKFVGFEGNSALFVWE